MKLMRAPDLVSRWADDGELLGLPGTHAWLRLTPPLRALLEAAEHPAEEADLARADLIDDPDACATAIARLVELAVLVPADEGVPPLWERWGSVARRFHTECRDANYLVSGQRRADVADEILASSEEPAAFKTYPDAPVLMLPRLPMRLDRPFDEVLAARRTHRVFTGEPLSLDEFSTLMFYTFAPLRFLGGGAFGAQQGRSSASAGGRHEVEAYVVVHEVEGVPSGLYHYAANRHCLELLDASVGRARLADLVHDQDASLDGAVTIFTTAVANRIAWKYRHPRAYRLWMYDAGHYGQTFALTATALGLGPFQTVAFRDSAVEQLLGVDSDEEFAVYLFGVGVRAPSETGLPAGLAHPEPT